MEKIKENLSSKKQYLILSFVLAVVLNTIVYFLKGVYPFGDILVVKSDAMHQYIKFIEFYTESIKTGNFGELIYSFLNGFGTGGPLFYSYYLSSPFNILFLLFNKENLMLGYTLIMILKSGLMSLSFYYMLMKLYPEKNDFIALIFSIIYPFVSFTFLFGLNIMWTDSIILLPLIFLSLNNILKEKKGSLFVLLIWLCFISNFYMSYIIGMFSLLYIVLSLLFSNINRKEKLSIFLLFVKSTIIAILMYGVLMVPTILDLLQSYTPSDIDRGLFTGFEPIMVIIKLFAIQYDAFIDSTFIISSPYIYSTVFALTFSFYYFLSKNNENFIHKKVLLIILSLLIVSTLYYPLNFFWHAFDDPTGFNYRYSFIISFLILYSGYIGLNLFLEEKDLKLYTRIILILIILFMIAIYLSNRLSLFIICVNLVILIFSFIVAYLLFINPNELNIYGKSSILAIVIFEVILNSFFLIQALNTQIKPELNSNYTNLRNNSIIKKELEQVEENDFYRVSVSRNLLKTSNDSLVDNYRGMATFNSSANIKVSSFLLKMGSYTGRNKFYYICEPGYIMDSFMGGRYIFSDSEYPIYTQLKNYKDKKTIMYKNPYAMGLGFIVDSNVLNLSMDDLGSDPIKNQSLFLSSILGEEQSNYDMNYINKDILVSTSIKNGFLNKNNNDDYVFSMDDVNEKVEIKFKFNARNKSAFLLTNFDNYTKDLQVIVNGKDDNSFRIPNKESLIYLGKGESEVKIILYPEYAKLKNKYEFNLGNIRTVIVNEEQMENSLKELSSLNQLSNVKENSNYIVANIDTKNEGSILLTTIPFDKSWNAYVDGKKVEIIPIVDSFVGLKINDKGYHTIEFKYIPRGIYLGTFLSVMGLISYGNLIYNETNFVGIKKNKLKIKKS